MTPRHLSSDAGRQSRTSNNIVRVNGLNQLDQPKEAFLFVHVD
ncbi:MAG: hypothetical protein ACJ8BW_37145 [Ktedonobacteraceae bacterium]|jgi:hypothetical protein